ncbi:MAG: 2-oxoglutarate dehydrogenase complex dihydrolipoyllysine-residue succinyltransferase [Sumerlaeia bacterium]
MKEEVKVPSVGESVSEGILAVWSVPDGGYVEKGATLFEIETEKVSTEVPAPAAGVVKHLVSEGDDVAVGAVVAEIDTEASAGAATNGAAQESGPAHQPVGDAPKAAEKAPEPAPVKESAPAAVQASGAPASYSPPSDSGQVSEPAKVTSATAQADEDLRISSVARKIADEHQLDVVSVRGTGLGGRITREDVLLELERRGKLTEGNTAPASPGNGAQPAAQKGQRRERMSMLRRTIAQRLVNAQHTAAILTTFNDVDMSAVMDIRARYKEDFKKRHEVGLGFMSFFVKATCEAVKKYPRVNAFIEGNEIVYNDSVNISVAVSTPKGLVVPVVRDAQDMSFAQVEKTILDFALRARENKIGPKDLEGGTFTISNGGVFGSMLSTPILNAPQSGILGMHRIEDRPVALNGQVVIRPMMYLALSYDHRMVDGAEAVGFLVRVKECIENPERLMLGV